MNIMRKKERPEDVLIYDCIEIVRIVARTKGLNGDCLLSTKDLIWNGEGYNKSISLKNIEDQLFNMGYFKPYYVWVDGPSEGTIYIFGNYYNDQYWYVYGQTIGYS